MLISGHAVVGAAPTTGNDAAQVELQAYAAAHPDDYVGVNQRLIAAGGKPLQVKFDNRSGTVDAATAAALQKTKSGQKIGADGGATARAVPNDAFTVSGYWLPITIANVNTNVFIANWDFRDDYVNGSAPDDFASVGLQIPDCARIISTTYNSYYYDGTRTTDQTMYLKDGGLQSKAPITGLHDKASGFKLSVDHGHMTTSVNRTLCGSGFKGTFGGQFFYEHNQDGGSATSVSASFFGLSVGYSQSQDPLQKSTQPIYQTIG